MGCTSSKGVQATVSTDVYRPAAASFTVFDINSLEEPWLLPLQSQQEPTKATHLPAPILEKLNDFELATNAPYSWSEVSKALEDLKPVLHQKPTIQTASETQNQPPKPVQKKPENQKTQNPSQKSLPFHTIEELEAKLSKKTDTQAIPKTPLVDRIPADPSSGSDWFSIKPVTENTFVVRDRLLKKSQNFDRKLGGLRRKDPLSGFLEKCPPGGADAVVFYSTTLHGVRRTFEDCKRMRSVLENYRIPIDERDVSLHSEFLGELRQLLGEGAHVPRLFVKGRYVGGVDEVVQLNEEERLGELLGTVKRLGELKACETCGGVRFLVCLECNGSCKVLNEEKVVVRCPKCNENGLVQCPVCFESRRATDEAVKSCRKDLSFSGKDLLSAAVNM